MPFDYVRSEAKAGRMGARLMAIVAEGDRSRVYLGPTEEQEKIALSAMPKDTPETDLPERALGFRVQEYGMTKWRDLFTDRQLVALTTFSDLVGEARERIRADAVAAGMTGRWRTVAGWWDRCATAYAEAGVVYLAFATLTGLRYDRCNNLVQPMAKLGWADFVAQQLFSRQAYTNDMGFRGAERILD